MPAGHDAAERYPPMPRKVKPTFSRLDSPPTRFLQLTDAEFAALPLTEKKALLREELDDIRGSLPRAVRETIESLRKEQSELYALMLRP
jgi:hypothetical protein